MVAKSRVVNGKSNGYDDIYDVEKQLGFPMASKVDWTEKTKNLLKSEMKRHGVTYDGLVERLGKIGVDDTAVNIRNKVARGGFTAVFFVQCLEAMGVRELRL
ncbi:MAG: DUF6471 domain-containing protein [Rhizomicrobium sp.]